MGLDHKFYITNEITSKVDLEITMRKLNVIQGYFEEKYDIENLDTIDISINDIDSLHKNAKKILQNKDLELAKTLLPIQQGFFYGNYEYNEYYWEDVQEVFQITKDILNFYDENKHFIQYWCWY